MANVAQTQDPKIARQPPEPLSQHQELSDVHILDSGEIMAGGYTANLSGHSDGYHAQGVAVAVSNKLTPLIIEVTPVNKRIMRPRIRHCSD